MPVPVVAPHSPAQLRRVAWSLVMGALADRDPQLPGEAEVLCGQVETAADLAQLLAELVHLAARLWEGNHATLADARRNARRIALQLAEAE